MPRMKFTARGVEAIKAPKFGQVDYWDTGFPGFGLRSSEHGTKTWGLMYRFGGRKRRLKLGNCPGMSLSAAREKAGAALQDVEKGVDPAAAREAQRRAETFAELADDYIERYSKKRKRSWHDERLALDRELGAASHFRTLR